MAQGNTKGMQAKPTASSSRHAAKAAAATKKGRKFIAPKKTILVKQAALHKNLTAKINKSIERQMVSAASSGKLTIMKNVLPEGGASGSKGKAQGKGK
ncbi:hypothetical protein C8J57DRAFT_516083 [Mycena rebaudengoi]|nr:hypothetical protein C8J57DRAFT_516083 [Mycena rebaudengoi]